MSACIHLIAAEESGDHNRDFRLRQREVRVNLTAPSGPLDLPGNPAADDHERQRAQCEDPGPVRR